jgi:chromosome segregation ATPase
MGNGSARARKRLDLEIERLKAQMDSMMRMREAVDSRFSEVSERIGEVRAMVLKLERETAAIRGEAEKAMRAVEETHPESIYAEFKKREAEFSVLRDRIASNERIMHQMLDEVKQLRRTVQTFRGIEALRKMSEEIKADLVDLKRTKSQIDRTADKVESIFTELTGNFKRMARLSAGLEAVEKSVRELFREVSSLSAKAGEGVKKSELEGITKELMELKEKVKRLGSSS